jgi:predicted amidohydrolase YtcJ
VQEAPLHLTKALSRRAECTPALSRTGGELSVTYVGPGPWASYLAPERSVARSRRSRCPRWWTMCSGISSWANCGPSSARTSTPPACLNAVSWGYRVLVFGGPMGINTSRNASSTPLPGTQDLVWLVDAGAPAAVLANFLVAISFRRIAKHHPDLPCAYRVPAGRVLVDDGAYDDFLDAVAPLVTAIRAGDPLDEATVLGPWGGRRRPRAWRRGSGTPRMRISCDELLSPAAAVTRFDSIDAAVGLANARTMARPRASSPRAAYGSWNLSAAPTAATSSVNSGPRWRGRPHAVRRPHGQRHGEGRPKARYGGDDRDQDGRIPLIGKEVAMSAPETRFKVRRPAPPSRAPIVPHIAPCALLLIAGCATLPPPPVHADLVMLNGHVITMDSADSRAEAVAIRGGKILAVGTSAQIEALTGPGTSRIDLRGLTVTPGLLDAHVHFAAGALDRLYQLDVSYPTVKSVGEILQRVADRVAELGPGQWVSGRGWDEGKLEELRYVYAADLDAVAPENPVWLTHTMGHYGVANSLALAMAGIEEGTPDPVGGTIDRYENGRPTGVLKEDAQALVRALMPTPGAEERRVAIASLARAFNEECMTGAKDPGIGLDQWNAYQQVLADGDLSVRIFALWSSPRAVEAGAELASRIAPFTKPYISTGDDHLISGGVKMYMDGSGGARTAWMHDDWSQDYHGVDAGNRGYPATDPDVLRSLVKIYHDAGIHVSVHAIGDQAIDWVVDSYAQALETNPVQGLRHGLIHSNIPTDRAMTVMAELQRRYDALYPEPSPGFMWWIGDTYAGNFGAERNFRLNPFRTWADRGIRWASSSDFPVTPFPARYGIWASMARRPVRGVYGEYPFGTAESVDVRTALRSYTTWAARQMFLENAIGSIEPGKYGDIVVWDRDLFAVDVDEVRDASCQLTLFEGRVVYRNPHGPLADG